MQKLCVRSGIRTHAGRTRLRPERSALDRSAILTYEYLEQANIIINKYCIPPLFVFPHFIFFQ